MTRCALQLPKHPRTHAADIAPIPAVVVAVVVAAPVVALVSSAAVVVVVGDARLTRRARVGRVTLRGQGSAVEECHGAGAVALGPLRWGREGWRARQRGHIADKIAWLLPVYH
jgi:hypothetical protein